MKGSVGYDKKSGRHYVAWYHEPIKKTVKLWFYRGDRNVPFLNGEQGKDLAQRMLDQMRGDYENGVFRIEKYTLRASDVAPYLRDWLRILAGQTKEDEKNEREIDWNKASISPATYKDYRNSIEKHLVPFFEKRGVQLHEIHYDVLMELLSTINRAGKGKSNTMYCLHACLDFAWRSGRIPAMPPFPKKKAYQIIEPVIRWLPSARQEAIINAIPLEHQPIFWWLKYHLRRPGEAMALKKEDFDGNTFIVRRGFSAKREIERTKTGEVHLIPAVSKFLSYLSVEEDKQKQYAIVSPYFFVNPTSRKPGKHYTIVFLERLWKKACELTGEDIPLYQGTKHSTASQMINELHYSQSELQMAGDWARQESVKKYGKVEVSARKTLLEGKVIPLDNRSHEIALKGK